MALLLNQRSVEVKITEEVVKAAVENGGSGKERMALLFNWRGNENHGRNGQRSCGK